MKVNIQPLEKGAEPPYSLLLLADPSKKMIDNYLAASVVLVAEAQGLRLGLVVLLALSPELVEIKNLAVEPEWQGKGIGTQLIAEATALAKREGYQRLCIGTANSSLQQLSLYQKLGFQITEVQKGFFIANYDEPIFENGRQAIDLIVLTKQVH